MDKLFSSFFSAIGGGVHPRQIALAVGLGIVAGAVSGWNLTLLVVLLAVLASKVPLKVFCQIWGLAAAAGWLATPLTFRVGRFVLEGSFVGSWLSGHADSIWLVLFDLDRYTLMGGLVLGLLLAVPAALTVARVADKLQKKLLALHEKLQGDDKWRERLSVRLVCLLLFGSMAKAVQPPPKPQWLRPWGAALLALLLVPAAAVAWMYGPSYLRSGLLTVLSQANQAEVNTGKFQLSLRDGMLQIDQLQIADPDNLDSDRLRVEHISAVLRPGPLFRGHVQVEKILLEGVHCDVPREKRAKACNLHIPGFDKLPDFSLDQPAEEAPSPDSPKWDMPLEKYVKNWEQIRERFEQAQQVLEKLEQLSKYLPEEEKELHELAKDEIPAEYHVMRAMHCSFGRVRPRVHVGVMRAKNFSEKWGLGSDATIELSNITSNPRLVNQPTRLEIVAPAKTLQIVAQLNFHERGARHLLAFEARDVDLVKLINTARFSQELALQGGKLAISGRGQVNAHELDLPLEISAKDLQLQLHPQGKFAGLPGDLWNQGLSQLGGLELKAGIKGPWLKPRLHADTDELVARFRQQLLAAGQVMLARAVDEQLARGRQYVDQFVDAQAETAAEMVEAGRQELHAAVDQGQELVARGQRYAQKQLDTADQYVDDGQAQAEAQIDRGAQEAENQIARGQERARRWLADSDGPVSKFVPQGLSDAWVQGAADAVSDRVTGAQGQARQSVQNAGRAARAPVQDGRAATQSTQRYVDQGVAGAHQYVDDVSDAAQQGIDAGQDRSRRYADQTAGAARSRIDQGLGRYGAPQAGESDPADTEDVPPSTSAAELERYGQYLNRGNGQGERRAVPATHEQVEPPHYEMPIQPSEAVGGQSQTHAAAAAGGSLGALPREFYPATSRSGREVLQDDRAQDLPRQVQDDERFYPRLGQPSYPRTSAQQYAEAADEEVPPPASRYAADDSDDEWQSEPATIASDTYENPGLHPPAYDMDEEQPAPPYGAQPWSGASESLEGDGLDPPMAPPAKKESRISQWSKSVGGGMKKLWPFGKKKQTAPAQPQVDLEYVPRPNPNEAGKGISLAEAVEQVGTNPAVPKPRRAERRWYQKLQFWK